MTDHTYRYWAAGRCPCCGTTLPGRTDDPPRAIGEGVLICGRCAANKHMELDGEAVIAEAILEAIARRDDGPLDRLAGSIPKGRRPVARR